MKWKIQKWNSGVWAIIALLLSIKSLYDLTLNFSGRSKASVCGQRYGEAFFSVASFAGFVLGYLALKFAAKRWLSLLATQHSGDRSLDSRSDTSHRDNWVAVFAMCLAMPAMALTITSLPYLIPEKGHYLGRETAAIQTLRTIYNNQAQFQAMTNCFGTLKDLANAGLIDDYFANGTTISGYKYSFSDVTTDTYCVCAYRANTQCGDRDFIVCEDGEIRYVRTPTARILKRGEGMPLVPHNDPVPTP